MRISFFLLNALALVAPGHSRHSRERRHILWTALFLFAGLSRAGILPAGGASSLAGRQLHTSTDLQAIRRQHRQTIEPTGAKPLAGGAYQSTAATLLKDIAALAAYKQNGKSPCRSRELKSAAPLRAAAQEEFQLPFFAYQKPRNDLIPVSPSLIEPVSGAVGGLAPTQLTLKNP